MSLQLASGATPDAEAVRAALTNSAIPCDPETTEEPERCLLGKINIAGAYELLTGEELQLVELDNDVQSSTVESAVMPTVAESSIKASNETVNETVNIAIATQEVTAPVVTLSLIHI